MVIFQFNFFQFSIFAMLFLFPLCFRRPLNEVVVVPEAVPSAASAAAAAAPVVERERAPERAAHPLSSSSAGPAKGVPARPRCCAAASAASAASSAPEEAPPDAFSEKVVEGRGVDVPRGRGRLNRRKGRGRAHRSTAATRRRLLRRRRSGGEGAAAAAARSRGDPGGQRRANRVDELERGGPAGAARPALLGPPVED